MPNLEHLEILEKGVAEWNAWRSAHPRIRPDLSGARLVEAHLGGYDLRAADLHGASLLAANIENADLRGADLSEADLRFCEWRGARLAGAKLRGAIGVEDKMRAAANQPPERTRPPTAKIAQSTAVVAALAVAGFAGERWLAKLESRPAPPPPPGAVEAAVAVTEPRLTAWSLEGVAISNGLMRLRLSVENLDEEAYLRALQDACRALEGRRVHPPVERIEVLRRDGSAGWMFERAGLCADVLRAPKERLAVTVAAGSRPIGPRP